MRRLTLFLKYISNLKTFVNMVSKFVTNLTLNTISRRASTLFILKVRIMIFLLRSLRMRRWTILKKIGTLTKRATRIWSSTITTWVLGTIVSTIRAKISLNGQKLITWVSRNLTMLKYQSCIIGHWMTLKFFKGNMFIFHKHSHRWDKRIVVERFKHT